MSDDPPRRIADSLTEAKRGSLVYVDRRGQSRSPAAFRRQLAKSWALNGVVAGGAAVVSWLMGGPLGLVYGGSVALLLIFNLSAARRLDRAVRLIAAERLPEAERLLRALVESRWTWTPKAVRALAEIRLANVLTLQGEHAQALTVGTSALARLPKRKAFAATRRAFEYAQVVTLINLDRVAEASARFAALPRALEGDYLRLVRLHAELYLALAEGRESFDRQELRLQANQVLPMEQERALLVLLAWAHDQIGARAEADRLLAVAETRPFPERVRAVYPKLADWLARR